MMEYLQIPTTTVFLIIGTHFYLLFSKRRLSREFVVPAVGLADMHHMVSGLPFRLEIFRDNA